MSKFAYDKVGQYGAEVVQHIEKNNGSIKAIDKKKYIIDIKSKSIFDKFAKLIKKSDWAGAEELVRKNQFDVLEPVNRDNKYDTLGWTQIEKSVFSSKDIKISTEEQEQVTLLIIKNVLGDDTKTWKTFDEMFHSKNSSIKKIFPDLSKLQSWWDHFDLQFREITKLSKFPNSSYKVYLYDGKGSFMDYVSDLVTKDLDLYSKKDSWNPADIWLVKNEKIQKDYIKQFDQIKENLDTGVYGKTPYKSIKELNSILKKAYSKRDIVGISLKKSNAKSLKFSEFNLQANANTQKLPDVDYESITLDCEYDEKKGFISKTSYLHVSDGNRGAFKLAFKSNTGKGVGNITYEFLPDGPASAFLGKVPKDKLKDWLKEQIKTNGKSDSSQMPQGSLLSETFTKSVKDKWDKKVKVIKKNFGNFNELDNFVDNLEHSYEKFGLNTENATMMQMVDFTFLLGRLKENKNLIKFATMCYYFAQKKGQKWNFGPFGKLY
jgi:hypothetical protein